MIFSLSMRKPVEHHKKTHLCLAVCGPLNMLLVSASTHLHMPRFLVVASDTCTEI